MYKCISYLYTESFAFRTCLKDTKNVNLRWSDADSLEKLRVEKGELYHLTQLTNLLRETCTPRGYENKRSNLLQIRGRHRK
jgi:hypothetical protein